MSGSILQSLLASPWTIAVGIFLLGFSIFVHELGHFLAARWRGAHAPRFSIGFGPKIFGWTDKRGTEWRLSWILLGGYVALPQLADMGQLEGGGKETGEKPLPPLGFVDKVIISVAGAFFNVLLAGVLAVVLWLSGETVVAPEIGYISPTVLDANDEPVRSPALDAGLQVGDTVRTIDGKRINQWDDIVQAIVLGSGKSADGRRSVQFQVERAGQLLEVPVYPVLSSKDKIRRVGISEAGALFVAELTANGAAQKAGLQKDDQVLRINQRDVAGPGALNELGEATRKKTEARLQVRRGAETREVVLPANAGDTDAAVGVVWRVERKSLPFTPLAQLVAQFRNAYRTIWSLVSPSSDINISKVGGAVEMVAMFAQASMVGVQAVLWLTMMVNVSLAVFNLLPIPVLDGGHVVFALLAKLRGRQLPVNLVGSIQGTFVVLLVSLMLYVNIRGAERIARRGQAAPEKPAAPAPAKP